MMNLQNIAQQIPTLSPQHQNQARPYVELAQDMEGQFIEHLLEFMDKTVSRVEEPSFQTNYYNSLLHGEHAKKMSKQNFGIQNMILAQLLPNDILKALNDRTKLGNNNGNNYGKNSIKQHNTTSIQDNSQQYTTHPTTK